MTITGQIVSEIKQLPPRELPGVLDFVRFLRLRDVIEPGQAYFWTKKWQAQELKADKDIKAGRLHGPFADVKEMRRHFKKRAQ